MNGWIYVLILEMFELFYHTASVPFEVTDVTYDQVTNMHVSDCQCSLHLDRMYTEGELRVVLSVSISTVILKV